MAESNSDDVNASQPVEQHSAEAVNAQKLIAEKSDRSKTTLFVSSLPFTATQADLESFFSVVGPIRSCFVIQNKQKDAQPESDAQQEKKAAKPLSNGCGFVTFALPEDAERALTELKNVLFPGAKRAPKMQLAVRKSVVLERKKLGVPVDPEATAKKEQKAENDLKRMKKRLRVVSSAEESSDAAQQHSQSSNASAGQPKAVKLMHLPADITQKQLYKRVRKIGDVVRIDMHNDKDAETALSAHITFKTASDASEAIKKLDKHTIKGSVVHATLMQDTKNPLSTVPQRARLIVRNLAFNCSVKNLKTVFAPYGAIVSCTVPRITSKPSADGGSEESHAANSSSGDRSRGFGFIEFAKVEDAQRAMDAVNGSKILNRPVAVDWSLPKATYERFASAPGEESERDEDEDVEMAADDKSEASNDNDQVEEQDEEGDDESEKEENEDEDAFEMVDDDDDQEDEQETKAARREMRIDTTQNTTLFIRNLAFETEQEELAEAFSEFGKLRYAVVTRDKETGQSRGTGFVCFMKKEDTDACLEAYKQALSIAALESSTETADADANKNKRDRKGVGSKSPAPATKSILAPEAPQLAGETSPAFVLGGRFLNVTLAVNKSQAADLAHSGKLQRRALDKRNMYLMREGVIFPDSDAAKSITPTELSKRQASYAMRKKQMAMNPNLFISKTRLSVRNLPLTVTDADLRATAKQAVIQFWEDVNSGDREPLEPEVIEEETATGWRPPVSVAKLSLSAAAETDKDAKAGRRRFSKIVITQAKILREKDRVDAATGKLRSKGIAFVEFSSHADALACLRWMNNNPLAFASNTNKASSSVDAKSDNKTDEKDASTHKAVSARSKRPIVEFAVENRLALKARQDRIRSSKTKRNASAMDVDKVDKKKSHPKDKNNNQAPDGAQRAKKQKKQQEDGSKKRRRQESDKASAADGKNADREKRPASQPDAKRRRTAPESVADAKKSKSAKTAPKQKQAKPSLSATPPATPAKQPQSKRQARAEKRNKEEADFESMVAKYRRDFAATTTDSVKPSISKWYE